MDKKIIKITNDHWNSQVYLKNYITTANPISSFIAGLSLGEKVPMLMPSLWLFAQNVGWHKWKSRTLLCAASFTSLFPPLCYSLEFILIVKSWLLSS